MELLHSAVRAYHTMLNNFLNNAETDVIYLDYAKVFDIPASAVLEGYVQEQSSRVNNQVYLPFAL